MKIPESASRTLTPEGTHLARLIRIVDMGTQYNEKYDKSSRKIRATFELVEETHIWDEERGEQPFLVDREYTFSASKQSTFRKDMESWTGKPVEAGFDVQQLIDSEGQVQITHREAEGTTYANITGLMKPPKGTKVKKAANDCYLFSLEDFDEDLYTSFPDWMQERIGESPEYQQLVDKTAKKTAKSAKALIEDED